MLDDRRAIDDVEEAVRKGQLSGFGNHDRHEPELSLTCMDARGVDICDVDVLRRDARTGEHSRDRGPVLGADVENARVLPDQKLVPKYRSARRPRARAETVYQSM